MNKISFSVGQAAGVAVMSVNADATLTNTSGGASVFAGLVISRRGAPGKVLKVDDTTYQSVLGSPIHPRLGAAFEPYRHVERAVKGGSGYVVRVCAKDMKVPGISVSVVGKAKAAKASKELSVEPTETTVNPGDTLSVGVASTATTQSVTFTPKETPQIKGGEKALFFIKDGDASQNRTLSLTRDDEESELFTLTLKEKQTDGSIEVLESHQVSFNPEGTNDMGQPAWIPTLLESQSTRIGAVLADNAEASAAQLIFEDVAFEGGTDGNLSEIAAAGYLEALKVLEASEVNYTALLSLGCYDASALAAIKKLAEDVRVDMFYDLKCAQTGENAISEAKSHSFGDSHQPSRYHFPFSCRDTFTGMNVVYGISCDAFVAKAKGVALVPDVGGWHYAPAGISRATIDRQNIARIPNIGPIDREAFVAARINPVSVAADGSVYIDDSLTTFSKNNYLRFQHVSSLMNAIARNFYEVAQTIKHEPDGITKETLMKAMTELLDRYVAAGALVTPRDKSQGEDPYVVQVVQKDIDLWEVSWSVCPTGTARRIVGKPILMR